MKAIRFALCLCVALTAAGCVEPSQPDASDARRRHAPPARFSISTYRVDRDPGGAATREFHVLVSGKNVGGRAAVPVCFLSFGSRGRAKVRGSAGQTSIEPGLHFTVEGTAVFDRPLPAVLESEDAYCRASP